MELLRVGVEFCIDMAHTYYSLLVHCVFSTKERQPMITPGIQNDLGAYMGGIARVGAMKALAVGGMDDHCHILLSLPTTVSVAKAMQEIKAGSSLWMHDQQGLRSFAWQEAYGAFSIGKSQVPDTVAYILNQPEHHRKFDFQSEFLTFLKKHEIDYDPKYVWG
jgi:REP element-mobilizing transposase RayT